MSQPPECLRTGIEALSQERYLEAIDRLEAYCYRCSIEAGSQTFPPDSYPLAHICLVKAYLSSGDCERALALCQDVASGSHLVARHWATSALPELQQAVSLSWQERESLTLPPLPALLIAQVFADRIPPVMPEAQVAELEPEQPLTFSTWSLPAAVSS